MRRFRYSDINFILLGALVEKITGEVEDDYVQQQRLWAARNEGHPLSPGGESVWSAYDEGRGGWVGAAARVRVLDPCAAGDVEHRSVVADRADRTRRREAEAIRARTPTSITCCGARCRTRRRGAWVAWPGMRVSSRRQTM